MEYMEYSLPDFGDGCTLWIEKEKLCAAPAGYGGEAANLQDFNMKR